MHGRQAQFKGGGVKSLSRPEIIELLPLWYRAWNEHDLDGVLDLVHEDIVFINWNGARVIGKKMLRKAWTSWFKNHGMFQFIEEETFIDEICQKVLFRWTLDWPCAVEKYEGMRENRAGIDILHFFNGKIIKKLTYSRTDLKIDKKVFFLAV